jgi:hypothetical protein
MGRAHLGKIDMFTECLRNNRHTPATLVPSAMRRSFENRALVAQLPTRI